ncbi:hypothetical protein D8674_010363 [Pyrus ussuriensis x Pyrus communis]|uniref:Uncharacterized protein n=1 Tax=Pyrus ussuriensis x Pyrus communis TaxID=2448454 RepID=A0A5N5FFT2_9ROSA|nr:hypothetical protein D8674_010363 [Pyrus ussuriensis x Pyrus communis]
MAFLIHEAAEPMKESLAVRDWFRFSQKYTLLQSVDYGSNSTMGWEPPLPGGPPFWVSFAKQGFYGFKPTILCPLKYFPDYVKEHINMRHESLWRWNDPTFDYYAPNFKKHPKQSASYSCPMEEKVHVNPEIPTKPFTAQVYMPHIPHQEAAMQPTKL